MKRFDVYWASLDPVRGSEISKTRPVVIISPNELNDAVRTVIVAPMTSKTREHYVFRVQSRMNNITGQIALDQIRTIDKSRLHQLIGVLPSDECRELLQKLFELFAE